MAETRAVTRPPSLPAQLTESLRGIIPHCRELLPPDVDVDTFRAALYLHLQDPTTGAHECTPTSLIECTVKAAMDGLLPGKDCYFLAFRQKGGGKKATYIRDYRGDIRLLERTGKVAKAFAHPVYTNDHFEIDYLADVFSHRPALDGPRGSERFYYGCIILKDGTRHVEVVSLEELDAAKRQASSGEQSPWVTHPVMMRRKTCIKRVAKFVQLTRDIEERIDEELPPGPPTTAQAQQNIVDLYGDRPARAPQGQWGQRAGGEEVIRLPADLPDEGWRRDLWAFLPRLTTPLHTQCHRALEDPTTAPGMGLHLLGLARDTVAAQADHSIHQEEDTDALTSTTVPGNTAP